MSTWRDDARRPRRHDGAPLRRFLLGRPAPVGQAVVPVVTTGLHCGVPRSTLVRSRSLASSPSSRRGSIAA